MTDPRLIRGHLKYFSNLWVIKTALKQFLIIFICLPLFLNAQEGVTTFGVQVKPIIPYGSFKDGPLEFSETGVDSNIYSGSMESTTGYSFGMVVRHGLTKNISFETGINYVKRNYDLTMSKLTDSLLYDDVTSFGFVSYNIPIQALVYIRLSEQVYMNASTGVSLDAYASGAYSLGRDTEMEQLSWPHSRLGASYIANLGFELRTKKDGYFYLGASYSQPFSLMAVTASKWRNPGDVPHTHFHFLKGQYLTLDLRYFFHEDPAKKTRKKKPE